MRNYIISVLLTLMGMHASLCVAAEDFLPVTPVPEWVLTDEPDAAKPDSGVADGATYLEMVDVQINTSGSTHQRYQRMVERILSSSGLMDLGKIEISFQPAFQSVQIHHLIIHRDGQSLEQPIRGKVRVIDDSRLIDQDLYSETKSTLYLIEDLRVGDKVDLAYTISGMNPVFGEAVIDRFGIDLYRQVGVARMRLLVTDPDAVRIRQFNIDVEPLRRRLGPLTEYLWTLSIHEPRRGSDRVPAWYNEAAMVEVSDFETWFDVEQWAMELFSEEHSLPADLLARVDQWKTLPSAEEQVLAAMKFAAETIRYFGIEVGQNSHRPHSPEEVLQRGYGDCKDKSLLLIVMLERMGYQASPVLVSTAWEGGVADFLPSPMAFNHVITEVLIDGKRHYLDPTRAATGLSLDAIEHGAYGAALVVDGQDRGLLAHGRMDRRPDLQQTMERLEIGEIGTRLSTETTYTLNLAEYWRATHLALKESDISAHFRNLFSSLYGHATEQQSFLLEDDRKHNSMVLSGEYALGSAWSQQDRYQIMDVLAHGLADVVSLPDIMERDIPVALPFPIEIEHHVRIQGPAGLSTASTDALTVDSPFLHYERSIELAQPGQMTIVHRYRTLSDHVDVAQLTRYYQDIKTIQDAMSVRVYYESLVNRSQQDRKSRLKNVLRDILDKDQ